MEQVFAILTHAKTRGIEGSKCEKYPHGIITKHISTDVFNSFYAYSVEHNLIEVLDHDIENFTYSISQEGIEFMENFKSLNKL